MTPLSTLIERAEAIYLTHGSGSAAYLLDQIEAAIRDGTPALRIRELDHILQLIEYRQRTLALYGRS
ncbi:hypothetical protein [Sphingomonas pokkalii]|uniref:Uncharacterized protein n=1 Tax=Sphingomonas pokkalii TaxID=2175090 RepID=A0A2U0SFQ6_9SPHN|nr:hypothetical protein [Sphingomonas pokkalii]PVX30206.1 hypothetical protein DD559_13415 [Sphingomonas pokkalii]